MLHFYTGKQTLLVYFMYFSIQLSAQVGPVKYFSLNLMGGANLAQSTVASSLTPSTSLQVMFVPFPQLTIGAEGGLGMLMGRGNFAPIRADKPGPLENYRYVTYYESGGLFGAININRVVLPNYTPKRIILYLVGGFNYLFTHASSINEQKNYPKNYSWILYTHHYGAMCRIKASRKLDVILYPRFNESQTYYLDALPDFKKYDHFITLSAGVSVKLGVDSKRTEYIDWISRRRIRCPRFF